MTLPIVDYLVARAGEPLPSGAAYDYVLAGDGLYLAARNRFLAVRVPVARCLVRGLPVLGASLALSYGLIPFALWREILAICRALAHCEREVLLAIGLTADGHYVLRVPPQRVGSCALAYRPVANVVLEIHSHHVLPARFSATDDRDEQGLRLYGVVGRLDAEMPELSLRVGAYAHFLEVPFGAVFTGELSGVRDLGIAAEGLQPIAEPADTESRPWQDWGIGSLEENDGLPG